MFDMDVRFVFWFFCLLLYVVVSCISGCVYNQAHCVLHGSNEWRFCSIVRFAGKHCKLTFTASASCPASLVSAMPKRPGAKEACKPKAKAKTSSSGRSTSAKAQSMSEEELLEYRNLHSKLTYRSKCGMDGAEQALQQLKTNRQMVLEKFRGDRTMSWVPSSLIFLNPYAESQVAWFS